jgi:hypothetical protein
MKLIFKICKKLLYFLATGSTSIFIAACYGMPANYPRLNSMPLWTMKAQNQNNQPIKGLKVITLELFKGATIADTFGIQTTDSSGLCSTRVYPYDSTGSRQFVDIIKDTDGVQNGGLFADTSVLWNGTLEAIVTMRTK